MGLSRKGWIYASAAVTGSVVLALGFGLTFWPNPPVPRTTDANADVRRASAGAFQWLRASLRTDGSFLYAVDPQNAAPAAQYNFVRHGGAAWALFSSAARLQPGEMTNELDRVREFTVRSLKGVGPKGALAVESDPLVEQNGRLRRAALGASALALLALLELEKMRPNSTPPETLRGLGKFLVWMQKPDGRFWPTYLPEKNSRSDVYASEYFPGEAALALLALGAWDPERNAAWENAARRGLEYLMQSQSPTEPIIDAWAIQAMRARWDSAGPDEREDMSRFARTIVAAQIDEQYVGNDRLGDYGCYGGEGRVAATAARLEGMLAALDLSRENERANDRWALRHSIELAMSCVLRGQVAGGGIVAQHADATKTRPSASLVRVDNVQHALMGLMEFDRRGLRSIGATNVTHRDLANLKWRRQKLANLRLRATHFDLADAGLAKLSHVDWAGSAITKSFFRGAVFIESKLRRTEWAGVEGQGLRFLSSDLREVRFRESNLAAADFSFSDLRDSRFEGCNLEAASFAGADLRGSTYDEFTLLPFARDEADRRGLSLRRSSDR